MNGSRRSQAHWRGTPSLWGQRTLVPLSFLREHLCMRAIEREKRSKLKSHGYALMGFVAGNVGSGCKTACHGFCSVGLKSLGEKDQCGQATKGVWGMSRRQEAMKGVEDCD